MSGGSLEYAYSRVEDVAEMIAGRAELPEHRAFAVHLHKVAKALHDLEWVWSCDYARGDELEAIRAVVTPGDVLGEALKRALEARADLDAAITECHRKDSNNGR